MPFVLTSEPDELPNLIPDHLIHLPLGDINQESEADKVYIRAQVSYKCQYQKSRRYFKASLVEGNSSISAFFYNKIADFCLSVAIGDTIAISKMRIEKNTRVEQGEHACHLIVDDDAFVWACVERPMAHSLASQVPGRVIKYTYTKLADLQPKVKANVWGVVRFFKPVTRSRGSDYNLFLTVVDPSIVAAQSKLKCSFFARTAEGLPEVQRAGDIVRIHRLEIQQFNDELLGGNSPGISILVFDSALDGSVTPRTTSSSHTMTPEDETTLQELREWVDSWQGNLDPSDPTIDSTTGDPSQNAPPPALLPSASASRPRSIFTTLSNIRTHSYCNLICQVVAKAVIVDDNCVLLRVWDGTKAQCPFYVENDAGRLQLLSSDGALVHRAGDKMVDVWVFDNHFRTAAEIELGSFICLMNVHANQTKIMSPSRVELTLHGGTTYGKKIEKLDDADPEVLKVQQKMTEWELSFNMTVLVQGGHLDDTATAVLPCHAHQPFSTLQEVQNHVTPFKFHVKAKVLELSPKPTEAHDLCQVYCHECHFLSPYPASMQCEINGKPCPTPDCNSQTQVVFMLKLLLHDGESSLQVGLWKEEAGRFLRDFSPSDVLRNRDSFELISTSLLQLCPTPTQVFDAQRPWMDCCLMSFSNNNRKRYLIFGTKLDT